jgi:hypothetical protein
MKTTSFDAATAIDSNGWKMSIYYFCGFLSFFLIEYRTLQRSPKHFQCRNSHKDCGQISGPGFSVNTCVAKINTP